MATAVFDTLQASRKLQAAGISEPHAEAIVSSMSEAFSDTVATKADIESVKKLISDRESTMLRWLMGMMAAAGVSVAIAMIRTFLA